MRSRTLVWSTTSTRSVLALDAPYQHLSANLQHCTRIDGAKLHTHDRRYHAGHRLRGQPVQAPSTLPTPAAQAHPTPMGKLAKDRQADKDFFTDLLTSAATRRDAKAYLNRLKKPNHKVGASSRPDAQNSNLFATARAVETSPMFAQGKTASVAEFPTLESLSVAAVKITQLSDLSDELLEGIATTLSQLSRLGMMPCIVLSELHTDNAVLRTQLHQQAERLGDVLERVSQTGSRKIQDIFKIGEDGRPSMFTPSFLHRSILHGKIPIILPLAYDETVQKVVPISADECMLALARFYGAHAYMNSSLEKLSLDRIIVIDDAGGIPSTKSHNRKHVFVNMEQEYHSLQEELRSSSDPRVSPRHSSNLQMLRQALQLLPSNTSGLITDPHEASNSTRALQDPRVYTVGTRRQKNPLIHNLLTDKPAYSSSLPTGRLWSPQQVSASTFVKNGLPLTILPNPAAQDWTADQQPWVKLTDPRIDLDRLVYLINDSFDRELDAKAYLDRVNDCLAGVIIAGDYEGGAILTWETPTGADSSDTSRLVPYLDKFAVLKKSQGAGGVADILFNAMVGTCFPNGVCWRSRKDNPVNKWYFERSRGTWKIPNTNWTMFWTTPDVVEGDQDFLDYQAVCRDVQPTWADNKKLID